MYNKNGAPVSKIKNPAYVAAHTLKGNCLSHSKCLDLVWTGDVSEYLAIFPEDTTILQPYIEARARVPEEALALWKQTRDIKDQREFAMKVKDTPVAALLFGMRKDFLYGQILENMGAPTKRRLLEAYLPEGSRFGAS